MVGPIRGLCYSKEKIEMAMGHMRLRRDFLPVVETFQVHYVKSEKHNGPEKGRAITRYVKLRLILPMPQLNSWPCA